MKKFVILAAVIAFIAVTIPAMAETGFNQAKDWIGTWGKCCPASASASAPAQASGTKCAPCVRKTDTLGNKVPCCTMKGSKTKLGI